MLVLANSPDTRGVRRGVLAVVSIPQLEYDSFTVSTPVVVTVNIKPLTNQGMQSAKSQRLTLNELHTIVHQSRLSRLEE